MGVFQLSTTQWKQLIWLWLMVFWLVFLSDLADSSNPGHLGLARVGNLLLASLREEEVNLVIVTDRAIDALFKQHRSYKICLCTHIHKHNKNTHTHQCTCPKHRPISSLGCVSLETKDGAFKYDWIATTKPVRAAVHPSLQFCYVIFIFPKESFFVVTAKHLMRSKSAKYQWGLVYYIIVI